MDAQNAENQLSKKVVAKNAHLAGGQLVQLRKICPSCGTQFVCKGDDDCWCAKIGNAVLSEVINSTPWKSCICRKCLIALEKGDEND